KSKGMHQQYPGLCFADSPRPQVKKCFGVKLADCAAVTAFYIVSKDLQLRFGINRRLLTNQHIVVLLEGVCFLCILADKYLAVEYRRGCILRNILIPFVAFAMWFEVVYDGMVIHKLVGCRQCNAIKVAFYFTGIHADRESVPDQGGTGNTAV